MQKWPRLDDRRAAYSTRRLLLFDRRLGSCCKGKSQASQVEPHCFKIWEQADEHIPAVTLMAAETMAHDNLLAFIALRYHQGRQDEHADRRTIFLQSYGELEEITRRDGRDYRCIQRSSHNSLGLCEMAVRNRVRVSLADKHDGLGSLALELRLDTTDLELGRHLRRVNERYIVGREMAGTPPVLRVLPRRETCSDGTLCACGCLGSLGACAYVCVWEGDRGA